MEFLKETVEHDDSSGKTIVDTVTYQVKKEFWCRGVKHQINQLEMPEIQEESLVESSSEDDSNEESSKSGPIDVKEESKQGSSESDSEENRLSKKSVAR